MVVDVIIPTYNRGRKILELFDCLRSQTYKGFSVIVINDGSSDDSESVILTYLKQFENAFLRFKYLKIENSGRAIVRNEGVANSQADLIIFFDDDVRPCNNAIEQHVGFHHLHKQAILYGPYLYDEKRIAVGTFQDYRKLYEENWYKLYKGSSPFEVELTGINGGNFSMSRKSFQSVGGFDVSLSDAEDFKLAYDLIQKSGCKLFFDPNVWVYHDDFRSFPEYIKRRLETRVAAKRMVHRYPEILQRYSQKYVFSPPRNRRLLYQLLSSPYFSSYAFAALLEKLPKKVRYKMYDLLITANCIYIDK